MKTLLLLLSLFIAASGFAQLPAPQKNTYVNDYAHVLSKKQLKLLNERIRKFEDKTTVQLAVILVNRVPKKYTIEEYALLIGRRWHVGTADNGLVYVMAIKQRQQRLEVARKLQPIIEDLDAQGFLNNVKPDLRQKSYASAIHNLVDAAEHHIAEKKAEEQMILAEEKQRIVEEEATTKAQNNALLGALRTILLVVGFLVGIFFIFRAIGWLFRRFINRNPVSKYSGSYYVESINYPNNYNDDDSSYTVINSYSSQINTINSNNQYNDYRKINNNYYDSRPRRNSYHNNSNYFGSHNSAGSSRSNDSDSSKSENSSYGNWGNSSSGGGSSSPSSGFNGGGASSSW